MLTHLRFTQSVHWNCSNCRFKRKYLTISGITFTQNLMKIDWTFPNMLRRKHKESDIHSLSTAVSYWTLMEYTGIPKVFSINVNLFLLKSVSRSEILIKYFDPGSFYWFLLVKNGTVCQFGSFNRIFLFETCPLWKNVLHCHKWFLWTLIKTKYFSI
jgi:hypothetical protein